MKNIKALLPGRCRFIVLKFYFKVFPVIVPLKIVNPVIVLKYSAISIDMG
jgi:hypothetical protein